MIGLQARLGKEVHVIKRLERYAGQKLIAYRDALAAPYAGYQTELPLVSPSTQVLDARH